MVTINGNFIGSFKLGDNIQFNLATLRLLYGYYEGASQSDQELLRKPIILIIASVIEAVLHDFASRARFHTREQSVQIPIVLLNLLRRKPKKDTFGFYIEQVKSYDVFSDSTKQIYFSLDELRKLRNRVHIQNSDSHKPYDENRAFTPYRKIEAEQLLEKIMKFMRDNQQRPEHAQFKGIFELPWTEHFP